MFGVKKSRDEHAVRNRLHTREFFARFPALQPHLLAVLRRSISSPAILLIMDNSPLYACLLLLSRLAPAPMPAADDSTADFLLLTRQCGNSANMRIRAMAARAHASLTETAAILPAVLSMAAEAVALGGRDQNHLHGLGLMLSCLMERLLPAEPNTEFLLPNMMPLMAAFIPLTVLTTDYNPCTLTRNIFAGLFANLFSALPRLATTGATNVDGDWTPCLLQLQKAVWLPSGCMFHRHVEAVLAYYRLSAQSPLELIADWCEIDHKDVTHQGPRLAYEGRRSAFLHLASCSSPGISRSSSQIPPCPRSITRLTTTILEEENPECLAAGLLALLHLPLGTDSPRIWAQVSIYIYIYIYIYYFHSIEGTETVMSVYRHSMITRFLVKQSIILRHEALFPLTPSFKALLWADEHTCANVREAALQGI